MPASPAGSPVKIVSRIGLGCSRIGSFNNPASTTDLRRLLDASFDLGITLFDTSDVYGQGDSERELGRFLSAGRRDKVFVVTKAGKQFSWKMRVLRPFKPLLKPLMSRKASESVAARRSDYIGQDFSPTHLAEAVEGSLRRLRVESLDGFLLHSPPASVAADHVVWEALLRLQAAGKVRAFGVSCDDVATLEAALPMPGLTLLQLPHDVLMQVGSSTLGERLSAPGLTVLAREVIRMQPKLSAPDAVRAALGLKGVDCVLIGSSKLAHVKAIVKAVG